MEEYRWWGPPGCGKTTRIASMAAKSAEKFGADQVSICSLTNAAVEEAISRGIPISADNMTTLHARCKRSIQAPPPAEAFLKDFAAAYPEYASYVPLGKDKNSTREERILASGTTTYDRMQEVRQRRTPMRDWEWSVREFYQVWMRWCNESGMMDYSSWIEKAKDEGLLPSQSVVFVDEAQDHTPLQLETLRSWDTRYLILVGDDDQSLYEWSGSIPEAFMEPEIPESRNRVLEQSYRVPRAVHALASDILRRISRRRIKIYNPTSAEGSVSMSSFSLEDSKQAPMLGIDDGREHMILVSCAYMLNGIIRHLKKERIPFHNPYRRSNLEWNPLSTKEAAAVRSYLSGKWTGESILKWVEIMKEGVFSDRGGLIALCGNSSDAIVSYDHILPYLSERYAENLLSRRPEALLQLKDERNVPWDYYIKNVNEDPKITVGTIHSVKGGEADCVHIFPDLSYLGYDGSFYNPNRVHRLFYVAVTRARDSVVLHIPSSRYYYPIKRRL